MIDSCDDLTFACAFAKSYCDAKPRYLGARRLSLSWTRQELCDTADHKYKVCCWRAHSLLLTTAA